MSAKKTRRSQLPEEDLAAAVAEIINSPITRSNLSFLRQPPEPVQAEPAILKPMGLEAKPIGVNSTPMGPGERPMGVGVPLPPSTVISNRQPVEKAPAEPAVIPLGDVTKPMGFDSTPSGLQKPVTHPIYKDAQPWQPSLAPTTLWQAEGLGAFIQSSRVHRIQQAQDALSPVEEKVYDLLWGTRNQRRDEFRLVHYSLQRVATEARLNIKTVRDLIPRLNEKGFLQVEHEADARRNIPTLYRVFSYSAVLADQKRRNRFYIAKTGKGTVYVHSVSAALASTDPSDPTSRPMGLDPQPMGVTPSGFDLKPTGATPRGPMGPDVSKPMGLVGTVSIGSYSDSKNRQTTTSPATLAALVRCVQDGLGAEPDHALLEGIVEACHQNALQTTGEAASEDELLYFTGSKARVISRAPNIRNHLAVLRKAVPECFLGESFRAYRAAAALRRLRLAEEEQRTDSDRAERQREAAEADARYALWSRISEAHRVDQGYDLQAIATDPELDEQGRLQAKNLMERLGRYSRSGL